MKKTIIALFVLAGIAAAAPRTETLTLNTFNTSIQNIATKYDPTSYTLNFKIDSIDYDFTSAFVLKLSENWGIYTQAGQYIAMDDWSTNDRSWVAPTSNQNNQVYTWEYTDQTLLDSWVSKNAQGGNANPGLNDMDVSLEVSETGSCITLGINNGTTSIIKTGYVVKLSDVQLITEENAQVGEVAHAVGNGASTYKGITGISNATLTYTIPEPTTATLSLLALAGLAARRRRK